MRIPMIILAAIFTQGSSHAQETGALTEVSVPEIADEAFVDSEADTLRPADKALVDAAMQRTAQGALTEELEELPLPTVAPFTAADYALGFAAAWTKPLAAMQQDSNASLAVQMLAAGGGDLYYYEWACETRQEQVVAAQVVGLLPRVVTKYVERMMLGNFIMARRMWGYDAVRRCDRGKLALARRVFEKFYPEVSKLAIMESKSP